MRIFLLCVFGAAGTLARYWMQGLVQQQTGGGFPYGTLLVNLAGCFFLGLAGEYALNQIAISPDWRVGITTGFFGAYTTFSTFGWETGHMMQEGEWSKAGIYVCVSVLAGVLLVLGGMRLGDALPQPGRFTAAKAGHSAPALGPAAFHYEVTHQSPDRTR
ncbi:MAG: fluoride efflux transporter CrcB, partial [Terriglobia bacterium]